MDVPLDNLPCFVGEDRDIPIHFVLLDDYRKRYPNIRCSSFEHVDA
jgi:hypothetical protein